ncbi:MAG TPA: PfkB family carbohydrate kinase [Patescibacteria group bacterium]|nr:PfkB family carbohydrate kinase [Patescibacteria group bacterium]
MAPLHAQPRPRPRLVRAVVLGDLALDVVLAPARPLEHGTDVPGVVRLHQGGSAANTARWLARLGVRSTLVCAVGRDGPGRALVAALRSAGVTVRASRPAGARTARIGMVVDGAGERSFVADRGAADLLAPAHLRPAWFRGAGILHLPGYSLLGSPLGEAAARAVTVAREAGALVTVDLASAGPLLAGGRPAAQRLIGGIDPDLLFTTAAEAAAFLGHPDIAGLLAFAPVAIVKRGAGGATALARSATGPAGRLDVATRQRASADTTGAGDAFDAGFLAVWLAGDRATTPAALRRAVGAGNRAAARQIAKRRPELALG